MCGGGVSNGVHDSHALGPQECGELAGGLRDVGLGGIRVEVVQVFVDEDVEPVFAAEAFVDLDESVGVAEADGVVAAEFALADLRRLSRPGLR